MKKIISLFFAVLFAVSILPVSSFAKEENEKIVLEFYSDVGGKTYLDRESLCTIVSGDVMHNDIYEAYADVSVSDYSCNSYLDEMKKGRTYYIDYLFLPKEGCDLPEEINDETVSFICEKGCEVIWFGETRGYKKNGETFRSFSVHTKVNADGNFFQKLFGRIADIFLKIKTWSLY